MHAVVSSASTPPTAESVPEGSRLSGRQIAISVALGLALWIAVALVIRAAPAMLFDRGAWTVLLFAAALPNAFFTLWLARRLAAPSPERIVPFLAVGCATAMLCDGVALTWAAPLYGGGGKDLASAAALLLWGVAAILIVGLVAARREGA
jgi:hypothetical protein